MATTTTSMEIDRPLDDIIKQNRMQTRLQARGQVRREGTAVFTRRQVQLGRRNRLNQNRIIQVPRAVPKRVARNFGGRGLAVRQTRIQTQILPSSPQIVVVPVQAGNGQGQLISRKQKTQLKRELTKIVNEQQQKAVQQLSGVQPRVRVPRRPRGNAGNTIQIVGQPQRRRAQKIVQNQPVFYVQQPGTNMLTPVIPVQQGAGRGRRKGIRARRV
ncbi:MAG: hypothetical protein EZS28_026018 [Streblomastix strix]|uniref:Uncharacterized protein n=1 Tax=Streblomastix strix TaxID=222440 RepID=A0A5J4V6F8_9EUKA|nr:MAG: hypothetical protein EZS28_026018 [Streblomastix strix]